MFTQMDLRGISRRRYTPASPPPKLVRARGRRRADSGSSKEVPVFEPYEETLPLQSGFYSYVIDQTGRFRIKWGNTSSHAAMVEGGQVCAAGRIRVNRQGNTAHVVCGCTDYRFHYTPDVFKYVVDSFRQHTAFSLSPNAVFQFHTGLTEKVFLSTSLARIPDPHDRLRLLDEEGLGDNITLDYSPAQIIAFHSYAPPSPPRLYSMHNDQQITSIDGSEKDPFEYGEPMRRLGPEQAEFRVGKNNFVIDSSGWIIIGMSGHQILSGGQALAAAGHVHLAGDGAVTKLDLNFSGHYRPPLSAEYVRYVYHAFAGHPLMTLSPRCEFYGRWFDEQNVNTQVFQFERAELHSDDPELGYRIESLFW
jgi:hypothetical protein